MKDIGSSYQQSSIRWTSGSTTRIRMQPSNMAGFLGICGYYVTDGGIQGTFEEIYLQESVMEINGQQLVADLSFLTHELADKDNKYSATCVKTKAPYKEEYKNARMKIVGPKYVEYWH